MLHGGGVEAGVVVVVCGGVSILRKFGGIVMVE